MKRLYLRIYLAVLASLVVFALAAGLLWRYFGEPRSGHAYEAAVTFAQNLLPPAAAPRAEQQAALEKLAANLHADLSLFSAERVRLAAIGNPLPAPDEDRAGLVHRFGGPPAWVMRLQDGRWLVLRLPSGRGHPGWGLFFGLGLLALAVGVGAYPVVRRLTRRLERLQAAVESVGAGNLAARVRVHGRDEVARLAGSFNRAAARIEKLVAGHKTLLANASHELRTPLARIRMAVELMKESADPRRKAQLERDIAEVDALIEEILLSSRLDTVPALELEKVDLLALTAEECARYDGARAEGEALVVLGDRRLLARLLRNLLENAKRHGRPPAVVTVLRSRDGAELRVADAGDGVPPAERERVFEPFYRGRGAAQGAGLGLALVRQIARRHGGEARCEEGFRVFLPTDPGAHSEST